MPFLASLVINLALPKVLLVEADGDSSLDI